MSETSTELIRWADAFPWLNRAVQKAEYRNSDEPRDAFSHWLEVIDIQAVSFNSLTQQIAGLAVSQLVTWHLADLFPALPLDTVLKDTEVHGIDRESELFTKSQNFESISNRSVDELERNNYLRVKSLNSFLASLTVLNAKSALGQTLLPAWRVNSSHGESWLPQPLRNNTQSFSSRGSDFDSAILEAIDTVIRWNHNNLVSGNLFSINIADTEAPDSIQSAIKLLEKLTPENWIEAELPLEPVFELLEFFLDELDLRSLRIIEGRILTVPKITLDALGEEYGLTRERIRQLESQLSANLTEWFTRDKDVQIHSEQIRKFTGKINTLEALLNVFPGLNEKINDLELPSWFVFDQFDDTFESDGTWVAVPSLSDVAQEFDQLFDEYSSEGGYLELEQLQLLISDWGNATFSELVQWAQSRDYQLVSTALVSPSIRSMNDLAFVALSLADQAVSSDELHKQAAADKSQRSFINALAFDPRMHRVGNDNWALIAWGGQEYVGIKQEILNKVDAHGSVSLAVLVADLPARFGISANSVRTYAASWPLQTRGDEVSRAVKPVTPTRPLHRSRRVYFVDGGLVYRVLVTSEHLRGSGFPLPSALAGALGAVAGEVKSFPVDGSETPFLIRWPGAQPQASSIRTLLIENDIEEGTEVALTFINGTVFVNEVSNVSASVDDRLRALCLMLPDSDVNRKTIAASLGLPTTSLWHEILDLANLRREQELIDALAEFTSTLDA